MAIGKKTGGRNFAPGNPGNPHGRPKVPEDLKNAKKMNRVECERILNRIIRMSREELEGLVSSNETAVFDLMVAKIINQAIKHGDHSRLNFLMDRLIGKVVDKVEHSGQMKPTIIELVGSEKAVLLGSLPQEEEC